MIFFTNTGWNISSLNDEHPSNITSDIKDIQIHPNKNYWPIWTVESTCVFSCKSTWHFMRAHKAHSFTSSIIWHNKILLKISFFMLRMMENKIPTNMALRKLKFLSRLCVLAAIFM